MNRRIVFIVMATLVAVVLGAGLQQVAASSAPHQAGAVLEQRQAQAPQAAPVEEVPLRAPNRISIPYGIADVLTLSEDDETVTVIGHGSCTQGEVVTVTVTITQTGSAVNGSGQTQQSCSGESQLQNWRLDAVATAGPTFTEGAATACGVAETYDNGTQTDTYEWCKEVTLSHWSVSLPIMIRQ